MKHVKGLLPIDRELATEYTEKSIKSINKQWRFSKFETLNDPSLVFKIASQLASKIKSNVDAVCVLATSGLALGVATALVADLPIFFFHKNGFESIGGVDLKSRVRPYSHESLDVVLIDSHIRSGLTSATCYQDTLEYTKLNPVQLLAPVYFDTTFKPENRRNISYTPLAIYSDIANDISKRKGYELSRSSLDSLITNPNNTFWRNGASPLHKQHLLDFSAPGFLNRPRYFIGKGSDLSNWKFLPQSNLSSQLGDMIVPSDMGIWNLFQNPSFIKDLCKYIGNQLDITSYHTLIGVGLLGTSLAIALAYHNRHIFSGSIYSCLGKHGIVPQITSFAGKNVLPLSARNTFGTYAVDAYERIVALNGDISLYFSVFSPEKPHNIFEQSRQTSLSKLQKKGVDFVSLCKP